MSTFSILELFRKGYRLDIKPDASRTQYSASWYRDGVDYMVTGYSEVSADDAIGKAVKLLHEKRGWA